MNQTELNDVLRLHKMWANNEAGGVRAVLIGADLRWANLRGAMLRWANLRGANLRGAMLCEANLRDADLIGVTLCEADLRDADLFGAMLCDADLRDADLCGANLRGADLRDAKDGSVCRIEFGGWSICVRSNKTSIGCKKQENAFWLSATPDDVARMHPDAKAWWTVHGAVVKEAIKTVMEKSK